MLSNVIHHRRLQSTEREVVTIVHQGPRELDRFRITKKCCFVNRRSTRVAEIEETSNLVESFACRIVDGLPKQPVTAVVLHLDQHGVPARNQQHDEWELERWVFQGGGVQVRLHVVDTDERDIPGQRKGLGRRHTHEQRTDQSGPHGAGNRIDARVLDPRLNDRSGGHRVEHIKVSTRSDLGNHATKLSMQIHLSRHHARDNVVPAHHECSCGLVATGLNAQDEGGLVDYQVVIRSHCHR